MLYALALGALLLTLAAVATSRYSRAVLYSDADHSQLTVPRVLRAPSLGLSAKPDYVYREDGQLLVEEVKSGWARGAPYPHHLIQLGVELLVVEESFGKRPTAGRLRYPNRTVPVPNTEDLRQQVLAALSHYRSVVSGHEIPVPTSNTAKCRSCPVSELCQAGSGARLQGRDHRVE